MDVHRLSDDYLTDDQRQDFTERYELFLQSSDEVLELISRPRATLVAAGVPVADTSEVTLTVSRVPPRSLTCGLGVAIHHGECHWGVFVEFFCE